MELKKGFPNTMIHRVHEFSENFINANNLRNESEIFYFSDETNVLNTPFVNQTEFDDTQLFNADIEFYFDY